MVIGVAFCKLCEPDVCVHLFRTAVVQSNIASGDIGRNGASGPTVAASILGQGASFLVALDARQRPPTYQIGGLRRRCWR